MKDARPSAMSLQTLELWILEFMIPLKPLLCFALLFAGVINPRTLSADEAAKLFVLAAEFEEARIACDMQRAGKLVLADATWIVQQDKDASLILADLEAAARRQSARETSPVDASVVERSVEIHGDSAVVVELMRSESSEAKPPIRRSVFWTRDANQWRIAHIHASPYLRWESAIVAIEERDAAKGIDPGAVVFIGSSSIRRWESLAEDIPGVPVVNRGFGGSQMVDSVLYVKRLVTPLAPSAVVVYAGDNDIGKGKSADRVREDFENFVAAVHAECPETRIAFISIKPSLKRWARWPEIRRGNEMIEQFANSHPNVAYLDIATPMLGADGMPRGELFVADGLHLTPEGYAVWAKVIGPWVEREVRSEK